MSTTVPYWSNMHTLIFALSAATAISFTRPPGRWPKVKQNHWGENLTDVS
jgi:hypothetical protein